MRLTLIRMKKEKCFSTTFTTMSSLNRWLLKVKLVKSQSFSTDQSLTEQLLRLRPNLEQIKKLVIKKIVQESLTASGTIVHISWASKFKALDSSLIRSKTVLNRWACRRSSKRTRFFTYNKAISNLFLSQ